jgi:transcription elongation factor Elf1
MSKREYDIDSIRRLYQEGNTFREIASMYGISPQTIGRILKKLKLKVRPTGARFKTTLTCYRCKKSFDRNSTEIYTLKGGGCICKPCNKKRAWETQQGLRNFGIKQEDYEQMLLKQNHKCLICGKKHENKRYERLYVDHDHETGKIRGLLCSDCNVGLGKFKDDKNLLQNAINYVNKYQSK